jgi:hypothetical protein
MAKKKPIYKVDEWGTKRWWLKNLLHREDGPAIEWFNGCYKEWWLNGCRHREDGSACEYNDGEEYWFLNGIRYDFQNYLKKLKEMGKSNEDIFLIYLKYK